MHVTSRKGERNTLLDARERRHLSEARDIAMELGDLADDQRAQDAAQLLGILLAVYSPAAKEVAK